MSRGAQEIGSKGNKYLIGQFFTDQKNAIEKCKDNYKIWKGKNKFHYIKIKDGFLVISESTARKCFPNLFYKKKKVLSIGGGYCLK